MSEITQSFYLYRNAWISSPHNDKRLTDCQCDELLSKGGWLVRNTYGFDQKEPSDFWYIIKDSFGGMAEHTSNERRKIRKALKSFDYRIVNIQTIAENGLEIIKSALEHYPVKDRTMNKKIFQGLLDSWSVDNHDFWGAFDKANGRLIGFIVVQLYDNACFYDLVMVHPNYKHNATYPYYGFFYSLNEYYLGEKKYRYVTDGSRSITEHSNIQPFLEHVFKFRKAYCKLKIYYKWWFGIVVRILYPFRNVIPNRSVRAVLMMHGMQTKD